MQETRAQSLGGEDPPEERRQPTPVFLLEESHRHPWWATVHEIAKSRT